MQKRNLDSLFQRVSVGLAGGGASPLVLVRLSLLRATIFEGFLDPFCRQVAVVKCFRGVVLFTTITLQLRSFQNTVRSRVVVVAVYQFK